LFLNYVAQVIQYQDSKPKIIEVVDRPTEICGLWPAHQIIHPVIALMPSNELPQASIFPQKLILWATSTMN
jgi:hypothetical protein